MNGRMLGSQIAMALALLAAASARASDELPRYKFQAGREMVYSNSSVFDFGKGSFNNFGTTTLWVTRQNKDGSWRILYSSLDHFVRTGDFAEIKQRTNFGRVDLFADGRRATPPSSLSEAAIPVFCVLPADGAQVKSGWQVSENEAAQVNYHAKTPASNPGGQWVFTSSESGIFSDVYLSTDVGTIYFDAHRGLIDKIESHNSQGYGFKGQGSNLTTLVSASITERGKQLQADADIMDTAEAAVKKTIDSVKTGVKPDIAKATARQALQSALDQIKDPIIEAQLRSRLRQLNNEFNDAADTDESLNKPAADWDTTDLDGHKHALADYRGQVVALDFWYRGCGWCMRAMPQIKALADQFHGRPVAILGMNTDREDKDARYVIDKLQLNYPVLHARGIPEKYGVQGFPTFIIIDQKGVVRARHVGYSQDLREEMSKTIDSLLAASQ
jgi:thiol-disulfide isomerase/thioredoxin